MTRLVDRGIGRFEGMPRYDTLPAPPGAGPNYIRGVLLEHFIYHASDGRRIVTPEGLIGDGASIPPAVYQICGFPLSSENAPMGWTHDGLFRFGGIFTPRDDGSFVIVPIARDDANLYAFDMARCAGHTLTRSLAIYEGLVVGSDHAWKENAAKRRACGDLSSPANFKRLLDWA